MHRAVSPALVAVLCLVVSGCVSSIEQRSTGRGGILSVGGADRDDSVVDPNGESEDEVMCVMEVPGTGISVIDIEGGVAVEFDTVARGSVGDLRRAVRRLGTSLASGEHPDHSGHHSLRALALARQLHASSGPLPAMLTSVSDVQGGARLEVRPADAAQRDLLRQRLRQEIGIMQRGVCPLLAQ